MASFRTGIHSNTELYVNERKTKCLLKGNFQRWTGIQEKNNSKNKNSAMKINIYQEYATCSNRIYEGKYFQIFTIEKNT